MSFAYRVATRKRVALLQEREAKNGYDKFRRIEIRKAQLKLNTTRHEWIIRELLDSVGYKYIFQKGFLDAGKIMIVDFYLPKPRKIVIEIDGTSHVGTKDRIKDAVRDAYFQERGIRVVRMTNEEAEMMTIDELKGLLSKKAALSQDVHDAAFTNWAKNNY